MTIAVIIVNFNTREQTLDCLRSLSSYAPAGTEVIVVDNGSTDGSAPAFRAEFPGIVVDEAGKNLGFAAAVNRGVSNSSSLFVLLLNPDTVVLPGSIGRLVDFAERFPYYGVYGGRTLRPGGGTDPSSCWGAPSLWSLLCFATGLSTAFHGSRVFDPESLGGWDRGTVREVPIVTGCLLLMRRDAWDELGGMDETFFLYGEDAEFSRRAIVRGWHPVIVPDAVIVHETGGSSSSHGLKMCMIMAGKATLLRRTWHPVAARAGVRLLVVGAALRSAGQALRGRRAMWWTVWRRHADWRDGYPRARSTLFALVQDGEGSPALTMSRLS